MQETTLVLAYKQCILYLQERNFSRVVLLLKTGGEIPDLQIDERPDSSNYSVTHCNNIFMTVVYNILH